MTALAGASSAIRLANAEHLGEREVDRGEVIRHQGPEGEAEEALLEDEEASCANHRGQAKAGFPLSIDDDVTDLGLLEACATARHYGDDDVRPAVEGVG